jgi:hypothetical protein
MSLNYAAIFERIRRLIAVDVPVSAGMREIIGLCAADVPHADWDALAAIDYEADVESLRGWILRVFGHQKPSFPIRGIFVSLCNPGTEEGKIWSDLELMATPRYDAADPDAAWMFDKQRFYPEDAAANSAALRSIYGIAHGSHRVGQNLPSKLRNDAEWPLGLAYAALAVRTILAGQTATTIDPRSPGIGVVAGFGDGDMLTIGELTAGGFQVQRPN